MPVRRFYQRQTTIMGRFSAFPKVGNDAPPDRHEINPGEWRSVLVEPLNVEQLLGQRCQAGCILHQARLVRALRQ